VLQKLYNVWEKKQHKSNLGDQQECFICLSISANMDVGIRQKESVEEERQLLINLLQTNKAFLL
jgi:hypothetical protein